MQMYINGDTKMTDEQMTEEYCNNEVPFDTTESGEKLYTENDLKYAFLAALKEGRPKWHDLWKDPSDLPEDGEFILANNLLTTAYVQFKKEDGNHWRHDYFEICSVRYWRRLILPKEDK